MHRRVLTPEGATFVAERGELRKEFLASNDPWFHPVNFATGPDGALYVVDFYRRFVEHPHYVHDQSLVAHVPWREGAGHGRLWRISQNSTSRSDPATVPPILGDVNAKGLVGFLSSSNGWVRDTAQRLLIERNDTAVTPLLRERASASENAAASVHALWTLHALKGLDPATLSAALTNAHAGVRETAAALTAVRTSAEPELAAALLGAAADPSPSVRLQVALALGECPNLSSANRVTGLRRAARLEDLDIWLAGAVLAGVRSEGWPLLAGLLQDDANWLTLPTPASVTLLEGLGRSIAARASDRERGQAIDWLLQPPSGRFDAGRLTFWAGFADGITPRPATFRDWMDRQGTLTPTRRSGLQGVSQAAAEYALSPVVPLFVRLACVRVLPQAEPETAGVALLDLLAPDVVPELQIAAAQALGKLNDRARSVQLFARWTHLSTAARQAALSASLGSEAIAHALLDAIERQEISRKEVDPSTRQSLLANTKAPLRGRVETILHSEASDRDAVIRQFRPALELAGNRTHGAEVFARSCLVCHAVRGTGNHLGPDLSSVGTRPKETLLIDILDPNQSVSPDYLSYTLETTDGEAFSGMIVNESGNHVTMRRPQQPDELVPRSRIKALRADGRTLMPDGLELGWTPQDFADLLAFIRSPDPGLLPGN